MHENDKMTFFFGDAVFCGALSVKKVKNGWKSG